MEGIKLPYGILPRSDCTAMIDEQHRSRNYSTSRHAKRSCRSTSSSPRPEPGKRQVMTSASSSRLPASFGPAEQEVRQNLRFDAEIRDSSVNRERPASPAIAHGQWPDRPPAHTLAHGAIHGWGGVGVCVSRAALQPRWRVLVMPDSHRILAAL